MEFRPCIDIHNGRVKQIIGGSLSDESDSARENFVSDHDAAYYANMYKDMGLRGGHVILLNGKNSEYYEATKAEGIKALNAYPGGLQIGGGINLDNAVEFLSEGASHVIVTSFVFDGGIFHEDRLDALARLVGRNHLVLDLSCSFKNGRYLLVTDRWQKCTDIELSKELFDKLSDYCEEFLVHAVNVEGTGLGIDYGVLGILSEVSHPVTYAGGIGSFADIDDIKKYGKRNVNFTVGSRLDIYGGNMRIEEVLRCTLS